MRAMQNSVAAIRAGRLRTRFTAPSSHRREPRLGLRRATSTPVSPRHIVGLSHPLAAVRRAARSMKSLPAAGSAGGGRRRSIAVGRREMAVTWSPAVDRARRPGQGSAAPWRV
jgi:hypothetical protein